MRLTKVLDIKLTTLALVLLVVIGSPIVYIILLDVIMPNRELRLCPGWEDNTFETSYQKPAWIDENFTQGWRVIWTGGQRNGSSGFVAEKGIGNLYAAFIGFNPNHERGVSGIIIQKSIGNINVSAYPYLVIRHWENSTDPSLAFSFGVTDSRGIPHCGEWYHACQTWAHLEFDLRKIYNGTIRSIFVSLTNDFNPSYVGGRQHAYIQRIAICKKPPEWILACSKPINASISSKDGVLRVYGSGNVTRNTLVTAQRIFAQSDNGLSINLTKYKYLKVSIRTSSIDVAARVVVWPDESHLYTVLLKTYNDKNWHTEIIDLSYFGITDGHLSIIELGLMQIHGSSNSSSIFYKDLSLNSLEEGG